MLRSVPLRIQPLLLAVAAGVSCGSTACLAQSSVVPAAAHSQSAQPASDDTVRLTDEERDAILDSNTAESAASARGELIGSRSAGRGVHGEIGAMIGSNGARGAYGAAEIPLGDNAGAVVSFESSRFGGYRR